MTSTTFKAAAIQFEPTLGEKARNIDALAERVEAAAAGGAALIVTPEMGTTGYCWFDRSEVAPHVEPVPGPTTARFERIARRHGCYIVIGLPEVDLASGLYYNSAVLIGPEGLVGHHRKSHPYIAEPKWAAAGDLGHAVYETPIGRIGLLICMDIHFVETARLQALQGVDIICHISNWLAERTPAPYWISRAVENGCYLIEANRHGLERGVQFSGGSCIIEPDGTVVASVDGGDGTCEAVVDIARSRRRTVFGQPIFAQRRPEAYKYLATQTYAWNPSDFFQLYGHRPAPPGRRTTVSAVQMTPADDVTANVERVMQLAMDAQQRDGAELLVFPELCLSGLRNPVERALSTSGDAVSRLQRFCLERRLWLVIGLAERADDRFYNTALVLGPGGIAGRHRKMHLTVADRAWAAAGDDWTVCDLPAGRVGVLVGHDAVFPEAGRILSLLGADLIVCPGRQTERFVGGHAGSCVRQNYPIPTGPDPVHWHFYRTRAGENNVYLAFANSIDGDAGGYSGVFGPDSFAFPRDEALIVAGEGAASLTIDTTSLTGSRYPTNVVRRKDLVLMRLPHHYRPLVLEHAADTGAQPVSSPASSMTSSGSFQ